MRKNLAAAIFVTLLCIYNITFAQTPDEGDFNFIALGDSRIPSPYAPYPIVYKRMLEEVNIINPAIFFHTGDLIFGYGDTKDELSGEFKGWADLMNKVSPKMYVAAGNHDYHGELSQKLFAEVTRESRPYFSFTYKGVVFIVLNTELPGHEGEVAGGQLTWLQKELEKYKGARAIFVFMHRTPYSLLEQDPAYASKPASEKNFPSEANRIAFLDLLSIYKVNAVFAGHEHVYYAAVYKGVKIYTLGGGGASLSAEPDKGGFFHYMLVTLKGKDINYKLMLPDGFSVDQRYYQENGKNAAEAIINNYYTENAKQYPGLWLKGIKFTLPKGKYSISAQPLMSAGRLILLMQYLGYLPPVSQEARKAGLAKIIGMMATARIIKIEPNPEKSGMVDVYVETQAPALLAIKVVVKQE